MKSKLIFACLLLCLSSNSIAQKILLKIPSITATAGEEISAVEFKVDNSLKWNTGGGSTIGKAVFSNMLVKKINGTSTNELYKRSLIGTILPSVVVEYYDASNELFFTITLKTVYVSSFYWLSPECPTCLKMEHQVAFAPRQIETTDAATGITIKFDISTNAIYN